MTFPVPPDARADNDFELVKGIKDMVRQSVELADESASVDAGEWMKLATSGGGTKAAKLVSGDDSASPALGAKVSWTTYRDGDTWNGEGDAIATKQVDLLSGSYQAKTKIYNTGGTFAPGYLLIAVHDGANDRGHLDAIDPGSATLRQLQAAVGKVIEEGNGVLWYESPAF